MKFKLSCVVDAELIGPITELLGPYGPISWRMIEGEGAKLIVPKTTTTEVVKHRSNYGFLPHKGLGPIAVMAAMIGEIHGGGPRVCSETTTAH